MSISWVKRRWCDVRDFLDNHIDPCEQLAHLLVGIIMVLSIAIYARSTLRTPAQAVQTPADTSADDDDDSADPPVTKKQWIELALGCNLVWGVITGVMYLMSSVYDRSRPVRLQRDVQDAEDDAEALEVIEQELNAELTVLTTEEQRARLYAEIVDRLRGGTIPRPRIQWKDLATGLIILFLVVVTAVPALVPFVFTDDIRLALRVTIGMLIAMLFIVGWCWGRLVQLNPWGTAWAIMLLGVVMAGVAEYMGG